MADIYASNWTEADASNNTAAPDGMPEGMAPSGVNDWGRAAAGAIKRFVNQQVPLVTGGTSTAYTLAYAVAPGSLVDGMTHLVQFNAVNGANPTLNVNALGAKPLTFYCGGSWSTGTNTMPPFLLGVDQVVRVTYNAASGTYRCIDLPLVLRQTVSGAATLDFQNLPTNVNNIQLAAQITCSVNNTSLGLQTFASGGSISSGGSDYTYGLINWAASASAVTQATASSIPFTGSAANTFPVMVDAVAAAIQSGNSITFNYGSSFLIGGSNNGIRGLGIRNASASISGLRLLPGSGTITGTATLLLS